MATCMASKWLSSSRSLVNQCRTASPHYRQPKRPLFPCLYESRYQLTPHTQHRYASHQTQGVANRPRRSPGKRLGLKRAATELVVPDTIIYRQRGTKWYPGENCGMGRDHTIYAKVKGYVVFYRDEWKNTGYGGAGLERGDDGKWYRRYIGVVFNQGDKLPRPKTSQRKRKLGMYTRPRKNADQGPDPVQQENAKVRTQKESKGSKGIRFMPESRISKTGVPKAVSLTMSDGYQYREKNWMIGRVPERAGVMINRRSPNAAKRRMARLWKVTRGNKPARDGLRRIEAAWRKKRMGGNKYTLEGAGTSRTATKSAKKKQKKEAKKRSIKL